MSTMTYHAHFQDDMGDYVEVTSSPDDPKSLCFLDISREEGNMTVTLTPTMSRKLAAGLLAFADACDKAKESP